MSVDLRTREDAKMNTLITISQVLAGLLMFGSAAVFLSASRAGGREATAKLAKVLFALALLLFVVMRLAVPWIMPGAPGAGEIEVLSVTALFAMLVALFAVFGLPGGSAYQVWAGLALLAGLGWVAGPFGPAIEATPGKKVPLVWFYPHVVAALLGMVSSFISALLAVLFIMQDRALKNGNLKLARRLPRISTLGVLLTKTIKAGALLYSTGLILGSALAVYVWGKHFSADPIEIGSVVGWLGQMLLYVANVRFGWADRRLAKGAIFAFVFWVALVVLTGQVIPSAHNVAGS